MKAFNLLCGAVASFFPVLAFAAAPTKFPSPVVHATFQAKGDKFNTAKTITADPIKDTEIPAGSSKAKCKLQLTENLTEAREYIIKCEFANGVMIKDAFACKPKGVENALPEAGLTFYDGDTEIIITGWCPDQKRTAR